MQARKRLTTFICYYQKEESRIGPGMPNLMTKSHKNLMFLGMMVLEWREHEHEYVDREFHRDIYSQKAFKRCVL